MRIIEKQTKIRFDKVAMGQVFRFGANTFMKTRTSCIYLLTGKDSDLQPADGVQVMSSKFVKNPLIPVGHVGVGICFEYEGGEYMRLADDDDCLNLKTGEVMEVTGLVLPIDMALEVE